MSRSFQAPGKQTFRCYTALCCVLALGSGCRFSSVPGESSIVGDAAVVEATSSSAAGSAAPEPEQPEPTTQTGSSAAAPVESDAAVGGADAANVPADAATPPTAADPAVPGAPAADGGAPRSDANVSSRDAGAGTPSPANPPSSGASSSRDAGASTQRRDAGVATSPTQPDQSQQALSDQQCQAELADCLIRDPLGYAECLRENAEHGCPEPDAGAAAGATVTPVIGDDGKPISQVCQAELANCIARNPIPENASACTETARKCK